MEETSTGRMEKEPVGLSGAPFLAGRGQSVLWPPPINGFLPSSGEQEGRLAEWASKGGAYGAPTTCSTSQALHFTDKTYVVQRGTEICLETHSSETPVVALLSEDGMTQALGPHTHQLSRLLAH